MDTPKPPQKPTHLLDDLESIREFLAGDDGLEPPLLTDSIELGEIPLLSDIVAPGAPPTPLGPGPIATPAPAPQPITLTERVQQTVLESHSGTSSTSELLRLDNELRAAAQLILQDVIDDFVPQIEAELKRRLEARLTRLLPPRKF